MYIEKMLEFLRNFSTQLACKFFTLTFVGCVHQRIVYCVMMVPLVKIIEKKFITPHEWFHADDWNKYLLPLSSATFLFIIYMYEIIFLNPKFYGVQCFNTYKALRQPRAAAAAAAVFAKIASIFYAASLEFLVDAEKYRVKTKVRDDFSRTFSSDLTVVITYSKTLMVEKNTQWP